MPFAKRVQHGPEMLRRIEAELADLCRKKRGVLVRLHALGDFYSTAYVAFWDGMLRLHPNLASLATPRTIRDRDRRCGPAVSSIATASRASPSGSAVGPVPSARSRSTIPPMLAMPSCARSRAARPRSLRDVRALLGLGPQHRLLEALTDGR
jgi:hypothetical protein